MSIKDLAKKAKLATNTVLYFELGRPARDTSVARIQAVFQKGGVEFSNPTLLPEFHGVALRCKG